MDNTTLSKVGTIFYALVVGFFGINHFLNGTGMQKMVPSFLPGGVIWVYITVACLVAALLIVLTVHLPAVLNAPDNNSRRFPMTNLIKDTGLAAAALLVASRKW